VWIDLDSATGTCLPNGPRRVYFHSPSRVPAENLPPGLFIRKPCTEAVFDVLWAGVVTRAGNGPGPRADSAERHLPGWLLNFHELNLKVLCRKCVGELPARLGYQQASLYLHDARHGLLRLAETTHRRPIDLAVQTDAAESHLMVAVARSGQMLRTDRTSDELTARGIRFRPDRLYQDDHCLVVPLRSEGQLWGVLCFSGRTQSPEVEVGVPLAEVFKFIGKALHHACAYDQARIEARVDSLTGLFNQRWMIEALEKEIRRAQRFGTALSVVMLDLDGLKTVNDQKGHAAGDCLLLHVAGRIKAVLRQFDGAARVGGDEFVVMLPATGLKGAQQVGRRLLQSIRDEVVRFNDHPLPITASVGVAEWRPGWDARTLIEAADRAMYQAKRQGRDQAACYAADGDLDADQHSPKTSGRSVEPVR